MYSAYPTGYIPHWNDDTSNTNTFTTSHYSTPEQQIPHWNGDTNIFALSTTSPRNPQYETTSTHPQIPGWHTQPTAYHSTTNTHPTQTQHEYLQNIHLSTPPPNIKHLLPPILSPLQLTQQTGQIQNHQLLFILEPPSLFILQKNIFYKQFNKNLNSNRNTSMNPFNNTQPFLIPPYMIFLHKYQQPI